MSLTPILKCGFERNRKGGGGREGGRGKGRVGGGRAVFLQLASVVLWGCLHFLVRVESVCVCTRPAC